MITNVELAQAEAEVERTRGELGVVEREVSRGAITTRSHERLADARGAAEHAAVRLSVLREDWVQQEAAREARRVAGRAAAASMVGTSTRLTMTRDAAVQAVADAQAAIGRALAAVDTHDQAVRAACAELRSRDLRADDDEATGGRRDGGLRLDGEQWLPVDGPAVVAVLFTSAVSAHSPGHMLARGGLARGGGAAAAAGRDDLLARVPGRKQTAA